MMFQFLKLQSKPLLKIFFVKCLICFSFSNLQAQEQKRLNILIPPDSSWTKEIFPFPISFAPKIKYEGYEEAWFPKDWAKKDSASFWSYAFGWRVERKYPINSIELEQNLKDYFDGLMSTRSTVSKNNLQPTIIILKKNLQKENESSFVGELQIFDAFTLQEPLILYVTVQQFFNKEHSASILIFRFSPKPFKHPIWRKLNDIRIDN